MITVETLNRGNIVQKAAIEALEKPKTFFDTAMEGFSQFFPHPKLFLSGVEEALKDIPGNFPEGLVRDLFSQINHEAQLFGIPHPYNGITEKGSFNPIKALEEKRGAELIQLVTSAQDMEEEKTKRLGSFKSGRMIVRHLHKMQSPNFK